jgi:uncharacterized protein (TIGR02099 family)
MKLRIKKLLLWLLSSLTRWLWRLLGFAIIAIAVIVSAGRELAPLLHKNKTWLEANLTASTGEIVTMEEVDAYWEGLIPELLVKNLTIGDALQIDSALIRVDFLSSARTFSLVLDTLEVNSASVVIPVGKMTSEEAFDFRAYLEFFFGSADISVRNLEVVLRQSAENQLSLHVDEFSVKNDLRNHWLHGAVTINPKNVIDKKHPVQVTVKFNGGADNIFTGDGRAYIDFGDAKNLSYVLRFLQHLPSREVVENITSMDDVKGRVWASWQHDRIEWVAETSIKGLAVVAPEFLALPGHKKPGAKDLRTIDFNGKLAGYVLTENMQASEYFIHTLPEQQLFINQRRYSIPVLGVQYIDNHLTSDSESYYRIYLPDFKLPIVMQYLDLLPSDEWRNVVKTLNPSGELKNVLVTLPVQGAPNSQALQPLVQANLNQVSVSAWMGAPALTSVDGYFEASGRSGFVALDSRRGFSMFYKTLYDQPMKYDSARGRVDWSIHPVNKHIYVGSQDMEFHANDGDLRGSFWLDLPPSNAPLSPELYLQAGLKNSHIKYLGKYLPNTLDVSLHDWLMTALKDGDLDESGLIYRGSLNKNDTQDRTVTLFSKVEKGRLLFDPAWPVLADMNAFVSIDNDTVQASVKNGTFLGTRFSNATVDVKPSRNRQAHFLTVQAATAGPGHDILKVMRDTPLKNIFGNVFDGWELGGDVKGNVNLGLRIGAAEEPEYQELDVRLKNNDLLVGKINLPLDQLSGNVHYSSTTGLSAEQMSARLWKQNQIINITPVNDGDGLPDIAVTMSGKIDPNPAATWAHLPFLHFFKGNIAMEGTLSVPLNATQRKGPEASLFIQSDMKGVAIDLPEPFKKSANKTLPSEIGIELWKDKQLYRVNYGSLMSAYAEQTPDGKLMGDVVINHDEGPAAELPDHLRIRTRMDQVSLSEWLPILDRYKDFSKADAVEFQKQSAGQGSPAESAYPVFDFQIKQLSIGSWKLDDMNLQVNYQQDQAASNYWNIAFQNAMMAGRYHYFDDTTRVPEVDFDTVKLGEEKKDSGPEETAAEDDSARVDPLADVIPQELPAMRVHAKHVWLQGADVGDWRYTVNPDKQGVVLDDLYVSTPGLEIRGIEKDRGATVHWNRDGDQVHTEVTSKISLTKEQGAKNLFGIERIIEAEKTDVQGVFNWKGSPAMLSFRRLESDLSFTSEKGRFLNSTASTDIMRVINVFNFSTWARRLKLDFTDLYQSGVSFDKVSAHMHLQQGKVVLDKPLVMVGPSGRFELKGTIDSVQNLIDASLIVTIPVNNNATWIAALAAGLPVAAGVWAVSKMFGAQIDKLSSVNYAISGTLDNPSVKFIGLLPELSSDAKNKKQAETQTPQAPAQ